VAAHEDIVPLSRLYEICNSAFELLRPYNIARVIARPFIGSFGAYQRTSNRKDIAVAPPGVTLLDHAAWAGRNVHAIGKIADIFSMRGISMHTKTVDNADVFNRTLDALDDAPDGSIVFANFVDFDQNFGHRRDVEGYAQALEYFDKRWPELECQLRDDDLCVLTADHGCDPTWPGSDHTREFVPQIYFGKNFQVGSIGRRNSFSDIGQTLAVHLGLPALQHGVAI
jgi:phosphopentomutase